MTKRQGLGFVWIAGGFGLLRVSKLLEAQGDLASAAGDRLFYHGLALIVLLGALVCFVRAGINIFRSVTGTKQASTAKLVEVFDEPSQFDADAALARYMERKEDAGQPTAPPTTSATARAGGFGRKGL